MKLKTLMLAMAAGLANCAFSNAFATDAEYLLEDVVVTSARLPSPDTQAPFASEVHTRQQIEQSGASTLFDYLAQHSSLQVTPSFGNRMTPLLDMRGYGLESGFQNIVATVDGLRLNSMDQVPQLLGAIPLADIERIEITKGSGSVQYGDGATAGGLHIITRRHDKVRLQGHAGNYGAWSTGIEAGKTLERVSLSAIGEAQHLGGYSLPDPTGHRDASDSRTARGRLEFRPVESTLLGLDLASSRLDIRYPSPLTLAQFRDDPRSVGSSPYTHQLYDSDTWTLRGEVALNPTWRLHARTSGEARTSEWLSYNSVSLYDSRQHELSARYTSEQLDVDLGMQGFDGSRDSRGATTSKDNLGAFVQGRYRSGMTTLSAGLRKERVAYAYSDAATHLEAAHRLNAWDLGINHGYNARLSTFINYNQAFQAPDVDRFFNNNGTFNSFIAPMTSRTVTLGLNHVQPHNRLKLAVFHASLDDEIYYDPLSSANTNFDRSHKYGAELQDTWRANSQWTLSANYTYTRALIDSGMYADSELPGVPRHGLVLGASWQPREAIKVDLSHVWRSAAWAISDFDHTVARQAAFQSTNLQARYRQKGLEWFAGIDNLFAHENGVWVEDLYAFPTVSKVYPSQFARTWRIGLRADF